MNEQPMHFDRDVLLRAIPQIMSFCLSTVSEFAMKLAMADQLRDLKGLISGLIDPEIDFELLEALNDPLINHLLSSSYMIDQRIDRFCLINNLDRENVMLVGDTTEYAYSFFNHTIIDVLDGDKHQEIVSNMEFVYLSLGFVMYLTAWAYTDDRINSDFDGFDMNCIFDSEPLDWRLLDLDDKNVSLLYELAAEFEIHRKRFWELSNE